MTWVRIDDGFARHPKVVAAGPIAMAMQVAALCYCNRELTDGFVPRAVARTLLDFQYIDPDNNVWTVSRTSGMMGNDVNADAVIEMLVWTGMWEQVDGGFRIHDYEDYQPTKDEIIRDRENGAKRQQEWRDRQRNGVTNGPTNAPVTGAPYPVPEPVSRIPKGKSYSSDFEAWWELYPRGRGTKAKAFDEWEKLSAADREAAMDSLPRWLACDQWRETQYIVHAERWLKYRSWENEPPPPRVIPIRATTNGKPNFAALAREMEAIAP